MNVRMNVKRCIKYRYILRMKNIKMKNSRLNMSFFSYSALKIARRKITSAPKFFGNKPLIFSEYQNHSFSHVLQEKIIPVFLPRK